MKTFPMQKNMHIITPEFLISRRRALRYSIAYLQQLPAEKTSAAEVLQKSLGKTKAENAQLLKKVAELEVRVAELEPVFEEVLDESEREAA
jgi:hypothetical protein